MSIINKNEYFSTIQIEIPTRYLEISERIVTEWNSKNSYEDRIELSDVFDYVFEKSDLEGYEDYIVEHFKKEFKKYNYE